MARDNEVYIDTRLKVDELKKDIKFIENECKQLAKKIAPLMEMQDMGIQMKDSDVKALSEYTNQMAIYEEEIKSLKRQILELQHPTQKVEQAFANMTQTVSNSKKMDYLAKKLARLSELRQEYINSGRSENDPFFRSVEKSIDRVKSKMEQLQSANSGNVQKNNTLAKSYTTLNSSLRSARGGFGKLNKEVKRNNNAFKIGFKNILKYGLGVRSVFALVNKLRRALVDGFKNLAQFNDGINPVNESLSNLKSSFLLLKNSFATAFAPLLTSIEPIIVRISDAISNLVSKFGQLVASLTGASSFTRAVKTQEKYNSELKKTQSYLSGLDEIKTYDDGKTSGATSPNDMFETIAIESKIMDMANKIRGIFDNINFGNLENSFQNLKAKAQPVFDDILKGAKFLFENGLEPIAKWTIEEAVPATLDVLAEALGTVDAVFDTLSPSFQNFYEKIVVPFGQYISSFLIEELANLKDDFSLLGDTITSHSEEINNILDAVIDTFGLLGRGVKFALNIAKIAVHEQVEYMIKKFGLFIEKLSGNIDILKHIFKGEWKEAWQSAIDVVKVGINGLLTWLESAINTVIGALNTISFDIPDFLPDWLGGGKHIGFQFSKVTMPRLATGTVVPRQSKEFMAILGDNNKESEVVSPLSTIEQALENVLSRQGAGGGSYQFTAQINRRTLFNEVIEEAKMRQLQNGLNPFTAF